MDLLDRLLGHDAWTTRQLLRLALPLTDEQWARPYDIGHETLRATVEHMLFNVETWTDLMNGAPDPGARAEYAGLDAAGLLARHDAAMAEFTALARRVRAEGLDDALWTDILDDPPQQKTYGGAVAHVITHNMHHRGEVMHLLHRLEVEGVIEGDLLSWEAQAGGPTPSSS